MYVVIDREQSTSEHTYVVAICLTHMYATELAKLLNEKFSYDGHPDKKRYCALKSQEVSVVIKDKRLK